tara:strand:- start:38405 stop:38944 length:540 start_codon:yes stop_codon:yes gene_type:complete
MNKEDLRDIYKIRRSEQCVEDCESKSRLICDNIKAWDVFQNAKSVAIYMKFHKEVDLRPLLKEMKELVIPRVRDDLITLHRIYSENDCHPGYMQILEPNDKCKLVDDVDLALIPGICFSKEGGRIGYGKGHFDKLLKSLKCVKVGIGYDLQVIDAFDLEDHDVDMDYLITENGVIKCGE